MCESGMQCCEGESCVVRVDQLKKHIWALMIWVFILSLGLGASIALYFIRDQKADRTTSSENTDVTPKTHSQLTSYNPVQNTQDKLDLNPKWQKTNEYTQNASIRIEDDGNYFLFLRVTLQSRKQGVNYTVTVKKVPEHKVANDIMVGHISGTENSTGFMGRGVHLSENTQLYVTCSPLTQIDFHNTYLGLIKF